MILRRLTQILGDYAGFGPAIVVSLAVSLVTCGYVSRRLGSSRALGWALVMSVGLILSATIMPSREALMFGAQGSGTCDFGRIGLASWWELRHLDETSLNVLLFVPLGISIGLCPRSRVKLIILAGAFVLPAAIELLQLVAVPLGRQCQSADVVDNLTGLVLGLVLGLVAGSVARRIWTILDPPRA
jgi:hypothetical protein